MGMETSFFWFGVFSGSFGVRSIVLCKCSGKYIDIYFKLKKTFSCILSSFSYIFIVNKCIIEALILLRISNTQYGLKKK